jgi:hypothetical protein
LLFGLTPTQFTSSARPNSMIIKSIPASTNTVSAKQDLSSISWEKAYVMAFFSGDTSQKVTSSVTKESNNLHIYVKYHSNGAIYEYKIFNIWLE